MNLRATLQALILCMLAAVASQAHAQATPGGRSVTIPVGMRFIATEANAPPGTCGCFWLRGGAMDAAVPLFRGLTAEVEVAGATVDRVPASTRGLSEITLMAGPRYTVPLRHVSVSTHALFGAVRGFDADFVVGANRADTSTNFAVALGGALELPLTQHLGLRAAEIDYLQTNLTNGADNRQRNIRVGAGIVFYLPVLRSR